MPKKKVKLADPITPEEADETVQVVDLKERVLKERAVEVPQLDPVEKKMAELVKADPSVCNHKNEHADGEVRCILNKGHVGNHTDGKSEWSDAAGAPTKKNA